MAVAAVALLAVQAVPLLGAAAIALIVGVTLRTLAPAWLTVGVPSKLGPRALQVSIVALGLGVNLALVASVAIDSFVDTVAAATTVKLARTLMIVPVVLLFAAFAPRLTETTPVRAGSGAAVRAGSGAVVVASGAPVPAPARRGPFARLRLIPIFVVAFLAGAALNTLGLVPTQVASVTPQIAQLGTVVALSAVGLTVDLRSFAGSGSRPIVLGLIGWVIVASSSLVLIQLVGGLRP